MDPDQSAEKENAAFEKAMMLAGSEFLEVIIYYMFRLDIFPHLIGINDLLFIIDFLV